MNKYNIKQILIFILILIIIGVVIFSIFNVKNTVSPVITNDLNREDNIEGKVINLCYYRADKTARGFYDITWLKLEITGDKINGDLYNLPAEKDSRVGKFSGTVSKMDPQTSGRIADVSWNSLIEGINETKQIKIEFGEESAIVLDYLNSKPIPQIDCDYLEEKLFAENFIRDNIETIATNKEVLGGTWYVNSVIINPGTKTGEVVYEDGHILSKANLAYTYEKNPQKIIITKFEVSK